MTAPLILGVDSGLDGAFCWMRGGKVLHTLLTRTIVSNGRLETSLLKKEHNNACAKWEGGPFVAYLEEPFNNALSGGASTSGYTDQCKRWGWLQGWLESWSYDVRGVQAKTWQRELLDLLRFEVWTEKPSPPRLAEGWVLTDLKRKSGPVWRLTHGDQSWEFKQGDYTDTREGMIASLTGGKKSEFKDAVVHRKMVLSHDTKKASATYVLENFPWIPLMQGRARNPHDGLADAVCIAAWASKKESP